MTFFQFNSILFYKFNSNNWIKIHIQLSKPNFNFNSTFFCIKSNQIIEQIKWLNISISNYQTFSNTELTLKPIQHFFNYCQIWVLNLPNFLFLYYKSFFDNFKTQLSKLLWSFSNTYSQWTKLLNYNKLSKLIAIKIPKHSLLNYEFSMLIIDIDSLQNRLLKVCYVPATSASLLLFFFSFFVAAAIGSTNEANKVPLSSLYS